MKPYVPEDDPIYRYETHGRLDWLWLVSLILLIIGLATK